MKKDSHARPSPDTAEPGAPRDTIRISVGALDGAGSILPEGADVDARDFALAAMVAAQAAAVDPTRPASPLAPSVVPDSTQPSEET